MEQIIVGQSAKFQLGLVNTDTHEPVSATSFSDTTFTTTDPGIATAASDPDVFLFTITAVGTGIANIAVFTNATFAGVSQPKSINFNVQVVDAPPPTDLTVTRIS